MERATIRERADLVVSKLGSLVSMLKEHIVGFGVIFNRFGNFQKGINNAGSETCVIASISVFTLHWIFIQQNLPVWDTPSPGNSGTLRWCMEHQEVMLTGNSAGANSGSLGHSVAREQWNIELDALEASNEFRKAGNSAEANSGFETTPQHFVVVEQQVTEASGNCIRWEFGRSQFWIWDVGSPRNSGACSGSTGRSLYGHVCVLVADQKYGSQERKVSRKPPRNRTVPLQTSWTRKGSCKPLLRGSTDGSLENHVSVMKPWSLLFWKRSSRGTHSFLYAKVLRPTRKSP
ncbi:hypothetical protein GCK72_001187 [Caenorhabditis remanei]|uniref:Uncharacterized protein n=1 Tax=Caenorhabditis remanei TaxID=31234 RepID=A0A6A5HMB9_CAERE|nr:hypothetical protein GCK72_001187 [Caenorhabditis remanei]KAF1769370.1 hypothetical protein GCK72_001187 [Caenorhabditis remanei]